MCEKHICCRKLIEIENVSAMSMQAFLCDFKKNLHFFKKYDNIIISQM